MFSWQLPIRFADVDHAGIVYYPRFFHYFHLAFEELWRARIGPRAYAELLDRDRVGFPAVRAECDFHAPLRFGDTATIEVSIARLGTRSIVFRYRVFGDREPAGHAGGVGSAQPDGRTLAAEGIVTCAVVDLARFVAIPIPARVVDLLADLVEAPVPAASAAAPAPEST